MTSNGSTLVECPPKNEELLLSEIYKHPPCVPYKRGRCLKIQVRAKPSKRLLHVDRSCVGLSLHCYSHDILNYLDDFMGMAPQTQARNSYQFLGRHLSWLALRELTTKAITSSVVVTCSGVQFDTVTMTMYVALFRLFIAEPVFPEILHQTSTIISHRKAYVCGQVCSSVIFLIFTSWTCTILIFLLEHSAWSTFT